MPDPSSSPLADSHDILDKTVAAIDWNVLASLASSLHGATSS